MLTLLQVLARKKRQWYNLDFTALTVSYLLNNYDAIFVNFNVSETGLIKQANLRNFSTIYQPPQNVLISDYITNYDGPLGGSYISSDWKDINRKRYITCKNIWDAGLKANLINTTPGVLVTTQSYVPDIEFTADADNISLETMIGSCLFSVNGIIHPGELVNDTIILKNATKALERSVNRNMSVIDFSIIGPLRMKRLQGLNPILFKTNMDGDRVKSYVFKTDQPFAGERPDILLIVNGQLHIFTNYHLIDSPGLTITIPVDLMMAQLVGLRAADVDWIEPATSEGDGFDLSSIDPMKYIVNNSWVFTVTTNELCVDEQPLLRTGFIDTYTFPYKPVGMLYHKDGTMGEYTVPWNNGKGVEVIASRSKLHKDLRSQSLSATGINNSEVGFISDTTDAVIKTLYIL